MTKRYVEDRMVAGPIEYNAYRVPIEGTHRLSTLRFDMRLKGALIIDIGIEAAKLFSRLVQQTLKRQEPEYHPEWTLKGSHAKAYAAFRNRGKAVA